jgi:hypothetical protein
VNEHRNNVQGYFSDALNGRSPLLSIDSSPNATAIVACHSSKKANRDILNFRRKRARPHFVARGGSI